MNVKQSGLKEAKRAFLEDIKQDVDFIEYKKRAIEEGYGVVIVTSSFVINQFTSCQTLITKFYRELNFK